MAVDSRISALPANPGVTPNDVLEVLDTSNTTNQATGENTKAQVSALVTGLPPFIPSGGSHAAGLVPDPGASAGTTRFLREDATWQVPAGGTGGSGTVTSITATSPLTGGVITTSGSIGLGTVPVANGGTGLTALGTALQIIRVNAGGTALEYASVSGGGGTPGGTSGQIQYNSAGSFGGAANLSVGGTSGELILAPIAAPTISGGQVWNDSSRGVCVSKGGLACRLNGTVFSGHNFAAVANTAVKSSALTGGTTIGSLTIDGAKLAVGQFIELFLLGKYSCSASTPTFQGFVQINGTDIIFGPGNVISTGSTNGVVVTTVPIVLCIQAVGASGSVIGSGQFVGYGGATMGQFMTSSGLPTATATNSPVSVDLSAAVAIDLKVLWGTASATNTFQIQQFFLNLRG